MVNCVPGGGEGGTGALWAPGWGWFGYFWRWLVPDHIRRVPGSGEFLIRWIYPARCQIRQSVDSNNVMFFPWAKALTVRKSNTNSTQTILKFIYWKCNKSKFSLLWNFENFKIPPLGNRVCNGPVQLPSEPRSVPQDLPRYRGAPPHIHSTTYTFFKIWNKFVKRSHHIYIKNLKIYLYFNTFEPILRPHHIYIFGGSAQILRENQPHIHVYVVEHLCTECDEIELLTCHWVPEFSK